MIEKIKDILVEYVDVSKEKITKETNLLTDLGLNSLDIVNLIVEFEDEFGIEIPDQKLSQLVSVGDVLKMLKEDYDLE